MTLSPASSRGAASSSPYGSYVSTITALSPYLYWECQDASGNLADASGNGRVGTASGTAATYLTTGPGNIGGAGVAAVQYADATTAFTGGAPNLQNNFAIEFWCFTNSFTAAQLFTSANTGGNNFTCQITDTAGHLNVIVQGLATLSTFATTLIPGQWNQVVIARASGAAGQWRYWLNGILDTQSAGTQAPGAAQTGSFAINGAAGYRTAHLSIIPSYFPTNGQVLQRYQNMLFGS